MIPLTVIINTTGCVSQAADVYFYSLDLSHQGHVTVYKPPTSATHRITLGKRNLEMAASYFVDSAYVYTENRVNKLVPLTLLNPSPPPSGPSPPTPVFGPISGTVTKNGLALSFSLDSEGLSPDGVYDAVFSAAGGLFTSYHNAYRITPMIWTTTLDATTHASYAEAVAIKSWIGASDALPLNWWP